MRIRSYANALLCYFSATVSCSWELGWTGGFSPSTPKWPGPELVFSVVWSPNIEFLLQVWRRWYATCLPNKGWESHLHQPLHQNRPARIWEEAQAAVFQQGTLLRLSYGSGLGTQTVQDFERIGRMSRISAGNQTWTPFYPSVMLTSE